MSLNPTSNNAAGSSANLTALFGLQTATAPFVGLVAAPVDWTVGIQYLGASPLLTASQNIAADAQGNIWIANDPASVNNGLTELSPTGTPMVNTLTGTGTGAGTTFGSLTPRNLAIDTNGNVWVATSSTPGLLFEYTPSSQAVTFSTIGHSPYGLAIDGNNNVFFGEQSSTVATIYEMVGGVNNATTNLVEYQVLGAVQNPEYLAVDTSGSVWAASATAAINYVVQLSNINTSSCGAPPFAAACTVTSSASQNTFTEISQGSIDEPFGLAADATGMWVVNTKDTNNGSVTKLVLSGATVSGGTNYGLGAVNQPRFPAVDGTGNVWVSNRGTSAVAEFTGSGAALSPNTGFPHSGLATGNGITVDPSGNVWVANASTTATSVFEIVGSGAPTVTPIALALKNNKVGQKP
jgi:streptogramin lyase